MTHQFEITPQQWEDAMKEISDLKRQLGSKQAKIDELMWEYCPNDMTPEQIQVYADNQRVDTMPDGDFWK